MDDKYIRNYAKLMEELGLTALEIKEDGSLLRLERGVTPAYVPPVPAAAAPAEEKQQPDGCVEVRSPIVGAFYCAPAENAQPFVQVGDTVKKGDVLCIVEAMKLMNEICSDYDGVVEEVCAANGQIVDYGCVLFRLRRA